MGKIRVANIIEDARLAGPQIRIADVAKGLDSKGIQTTVVYPIRDSERFKNRLKDNKIRSVQLPINRLSKDKKSLVLYLCFFVYELILLFLFFKKERFDIVHVSGGVWQFKGVIAGKFAGCKVLWHLNDTQMSGLFKCIFQMLSTYLADGIIVAGKRVAKYYVGALRMDRGAVYEIQAPVDSSYFNPEIQSSHKRKTILCQNKINIVSVGNINPVKGFEYFIEVASLLKDVENCAFHIIGPHLESQKKYSEKLLKLKAAHGLKRLYFHGASEDVRAVLAEADIYVCSSKSEASPISVWEAMSMSVPVVCTDVGDIPYFVRNFENGFVVPCRNAKALASKVRFLAESEELRNQYGRRAREIIINYLDSAIIIDRHEAVYNEICGKK